MIISHYWKKERIFNENESQDHANNCKIYLATSGLIAHKVISLCLCMCVCICERILKKVNFN